MIDTDRTKDRRGWAALRDSRGDAPTDPPKAPDAPEKDADDAPAGEAPAPAPDPWRGKIPVEDRAALAHMAREAMAAMLWVQRQRAAGRLPN